MTDRPGADPARGREKLSRLGDEPHDPDRAEPDPERGRESQARTRSEDAAREDEKRDDES